MQAATMDDIDIRRPITQVPSSAALDALDDSATLARPAAAMLEQALQQRAVMQGCTRLVCGTVDSTFDLELLAQALRAAIAANGALSPQEWFEQEFCLSRSLVGAGVVWAMRAANSALLSPTWSCSHSCLPVQQSCPLCATMKRERQHCLLCDTSVTQLSAVRDIGHRSTGPASSVALSGRTTHTRRVRGGQPVQPQRPAAELSSLCRWQRSSRHSDGPQLHRNLRRARRCGL